MKALFKTVLVMSVIGVLVARSENAMQVTNVKLDQNKLDKKVSITYDLANNGEPAYVLFDIRTNNVSIGMDRFVSVSGDSSFGSAWLEPVASGDGAKKIVWDAARDWPNQAVDNAEAFVMAWYTNSVQSISNVYMVVDVSEGNGAESFPVRYTLNPPDLSDSACRTSQIWLRRCEPGTFLQGTTAATDAFARQSNEAQHQVTFTKAFFAGVFLVTERQWTRVLGGNPPLGNNWAEGGWGYAVNNVSIQMIRGSDNNDPENPYYWPNSDLVSPTNFMGVLRNKTGMSRFDLPTESQWEYACRAGTPGPWNNGILTPNGTEEEVGTNLTRIAWYFENSGNSKYHNVGEKIPNAWGLYDMHGLESEWCLDRYESLVAITGPCVGERGCDGGTSGDKRIMRGGNYTLTLAGEAWNGARRYMRSGARHLDSNGSAGYANQGFRIFYTCE